MFFKLAVTLISDPMLMRHARITLTRVQVFRVDLDSPVLPDSLPLGPSQGLNPIPSRIASTDLFAFLLSLKVSIKKAVIQEDRIIF